MCGPHCSSSLETIKQFHALHLETACSFICPHKKYDIEFFNAAVLDEVRAGAHVKLVLQVASCMHLYGLICMRRHTVNS